MTVPIQVLPIEDKDAWLESAIRAWEAEINAEGWGQVPKLALLMRLPGGAGLGVAQIHVEPVLMGQPDMLFAVLADKRVRHLHQFFGRDHWAGMLPVGAMLCDEAWALRNSQLNLDLFVAGTGEVKDHPNRVEVRRVMVVAPREENDCALMRRRDSLSPELSPGIPPEGTRGAGGQVISDYSLRDNMRQVVLKLCPPDMR